MITLKPGSVFASRYQIVGPISAGGMGAIFEVIHMGTRRRRALKVMLPHVVSDPRMRERFSLEAVVAAEIESEHIVEVFDAGIDPESQCPFLVMELLRGEDLGARLKRGERYSAAETLDLVDQLTRALEKTHERGIVHRDLKPDNLFLTRRDDGAVRIKILDFGIAKVVDPDRSGPQATTNTFGTPFYMAREQITGESALIGPASDLYAVAHIVFSMLTGSPYFQEEAHASGSNILAVLMAVGKGIAEPASARAHRRGVELPPSFDAWFAHAVAPLPSQRFTAARALYAGLAEALRDPVRVFGPNPFVKAGGNDSGPVASSPSQASGSMPQPSASQNAASQNAGGSGPVGYVAASTGGASTTGSASRPMGQPPVAIDRVLNETGGSQSMTNRAPPFGEKRSRAPWFVGGAIVIGALAGIGAWRFSIASSARSAANQTTSTSAERSVESAPSASSPKPSEVSVGASPSSTPATSGATSPQPSGAASNSTPSASSSASSGAPVNGKRPPGAPPGSKPQGQGPEVWETR